MALLRVACVSGLLALRLRRRCVLLHFRCVWGAQRC